MIALIDLALVIVLVNLGQVEEILGDELSLCVQGEMHLHSKIDNLQLGWHTSWVQNALEMNQLSQLYSDFSFANQNGFQVKTFTFTI